MRRAGTIMLRAVMAAAVWVACQGAVAAEFEVVGHRGARGLFPENTIPAFAAALDIGVTAIELDVAVSRDGVVVVSHDQRLNPDLTRSADGEWLAGQGRPIVQLTLEELKSYDVGRLNPRVRYSRTFDSQVAVDGARIPTLGEVIDQVRGHRRNRDVRLDVEIKGRPDRRRETLAPEEFADKVLAVLRDEGMEGRTNILSFDWRVLRHVQIIAPDMTTVCLSMQSRNLNNIAKGRPGPSPWTAGLDVDDLGGSVPRLVHAAGCAVWSVYFRELDGAQLDEARTLGLKVLVWTVNSPSEMRKFIELGVDGIVTDYPDRLIEVLGKR